MTQLRERLHDVCAVAEAALRPGPAREALAAAKVRLSEGGLRVAVGGRLNAGKSTLVNSLLGQGLAMTDATECTRIVTWFVYGDQNRVTVTPKQGEPYAIATAPGGGVPAQLGTAPEDVARLTVATSNRRLREQYTVVDTPGLDALSGLDEYSMLALADADALLYVMPHPGERDAEALAAFRGGAGGAGMCAVNAIGVLSRIDQLGDGEGDPWPVARRIAARYHQRLTTQVAEVIPIVGLLAQTALGETFTEDDTQLLRRLVPLSEADRDELLFSPDDFRAGDVTDLPPAARERLLGLLGVYGIRQALAALDGGVTGTVRLLAELRRLSGIDALTAAIDRHFAGSADWLRVDRVLSNLEPLTWTGRDADERDVLAGLREELAQVRRDPRLRRAALATVLTAAGEGALAEAGEELLALVTGEDPAARLGQPPDTDPAQLRAAADRQIERWRALEGSPSRSLARHARTVREAYESLYFELEGEQG
ncbi:dynamin family protein [Dactylosporangium sp. NPDC000521]|uniref:dynamin family protein n=1 Tax=Dactylosporangium sp. NPDC000521 TaxID=3363975 RepID=UPI00369B19E8